MSKEIERYYMKGGAYQPKERPPFIEAIDLQLKCWYQFEPHDPIEEREQKIQIERFLDIKRILTECEEKGICYELLFNGKEYQIRIKNGE